MHERFRTRQAWVRGLSNLNLIREFRTLEAIARTRKRNPEDGFFLRITIVGDEISRRKAQGELTRDEWESAQTAG
jgi:hypothetical protein